jgi:hypothetical protein
MAGHVARVVEAVAEVCMKIMERKLYLENQVTHKHAPTRRESCHCAALLP